MRKTVRGFTLIELMAGMAILIIMVLFLNKIFADSTSIWKLGNKRVQSNSDGRAVIDYIVQDLAQAVADDVTSLKLYSQSTNVLGVQCDRLSFVTLNNTAADPQEREARQVTYFIANMVDQFDNAITNRFCIKRAESVTIPSALVCYTNADWWKIPVSGPPTVLENARTLEFWVYDQNGQYHADYEPKVFGPPAWIDICVEVLGEDDAIRVGELGSQGAAYADQVARRYVGRAYLSNQRGYAQAK